MDVNPGDLQHRLGINMATAIGFIIGVIWGSFLGGPQGMIITGSLMALLLRFGVALIVNKSSETVSSFLLPNDRGGTGAGYSHIEALEARGDFPKALEEWEKVIAESPDAIAARIHAAELYARKGDNPERASQLYREAQLHQKSPDETKRYVTQRLVDLYLGPLKDEGRALVELRRVANRWPDSPEGKGALQAIGSIKEKRKTNGER